MIKKDYHIHSLLCDGGNSLEEMLLAAIEKGLEEIGFSGHSWLPMDPGWTMTPEKAIEYRNTISELKEKYKGKISIKMGIEQDFLSPTDELGMYEYIIGSVHGLMPEGKYFSLDYSPELFKEGIKEFYGGDPYKMAEDYFSAVGNIYDQTGCDIVGHFDLITKFNEKEKIINTLNPRYIKAYEKALEKLADKPVIFEINTGAISRGWRTGQYPEDRILKIIGEMKKPVILSSDSHSIDTLLYGFEECRGLAEKYGLELRRGLPKKK